MTTSEYPLNIALVCLVVLQVRGIRLTAAALLLPVVMTAWVASQILHTIPTGLVVSSETGAVGSGDDRCTVQLPSIWVWASLPKTRCGSAAWRSCRKRSKLG
jgi:hypothetical protein